LTLARSQQLVTLLAQRVNLIYETASCACLILLNPLLEIFPYFIWPRSPCVCHSGPSALLMAVLNSSMSSHEFSIMSKAAIQAASSSSWQLQARTMKSALALISASDIIVEMDISQMACPFGPDMYFLLFSHGPGVCVIFSPSKNQQVNRPSLPVCAGVEPEPAFTSISPLSAT
jgi:hypothetical protein